MGPSGAVGPAGVTGPSAVARLAGLRFSVQGDSIAADYGNAWQKIVIARTGMTLVSQDARPGRVFSTAFECYGNPSVGGAPSVYDGAYSFGGGKCSDFNTGVITGDTLAQSLANVDILVIALGTNDLNSHLGVLGDATTAPTLYGNMRWVVETYLTAKPSLRIVLVTAQYVTGRGTLGTQVANATVAYGASVGVPVVNMAALGGVNAVSASALLRDGLHPSDDAFNRIYGPVIAQAILGVN